MFDFSNPANIGKEYKGFILLNIDDLPDYKTKAAYLRHKRTGLEVYHILKDDKENLFSFAFRTFAKDSKGTAHIMEHSVLCGSEKYPLKEPFTTLCSSSINTFLNALTYPDKTVYPGSSLVRADYFNMMDVYADAVFFPKLDHATFLQEGHRLEMDENGKLSIQGVVYNEMKGNYSSFTSVAYSELISSLFPDSFSEYDSGGDPLNIPELTYEQFLDFHQKFYAPDNCLLFLYGDIPTAEQIDFLDERFIPRLEKKYNCTSDVPNADQKTPIVKPEIKELQKLNKHTESKTIRAIAPNTGATGNIAVMQMYTGVGDMEKYYLSEVLCGNDSSPMSKILKESGLGEEEACGNFGQFQEEVFSWGMLGVKKGDEEKLFDLITKSLKDIYEKGVSQEDIDSAVMGIDFNLREVTRYWGPYSMVIMEKVLKGWNYGKPCSDQLTPITSFEKVKAAIKADKDYTKKLIKKYFLDPEVIIKFIAEPTEDYFKQRNEAEEKLIKKLESNLDKEKLKNDLDELHAYQAHQETPEETNCIPSTDINTLDRKLDFTKMDLKFLEGNNNTKVPLFVNQEATNGIFYIDVLFPFDHIAPENYKYITFLSSIITNLGWNGKPWDKCIADCAMVMGDVWGRTLCGQISDSPECIDFAKKYDEYNFMGRNWIGLSCKALTSQTKETLDLFAEIITKMDFEDAQRFKTLAVQNKMEKQSSIVNQGREFAIRRAQATLTPRQALTEIMSGITQLQVAKEYTENKPEDSLKIMKDLYYSCIKAGGVLHITADEDSLNTIMPMLGSFVKAADIQPLIPVKQLELKEILPYVYQSEALAGDIKEQDIKVDSQTGYAVLATKCSPHMTVDAASEAVVNSWLGLHTLWDKVRTTGGAYGASAWADNANGTYIFASYRDPTPVNTLEVFKDCIKEACENPIPEEDITKTIVSMYGDFIYPECPKDKGANCFQAFLYGNPVEFRQKRLEDLFNVTPESISRVTKKLADSIKSVCSTAVFCDKSVKTSGKKIVLPL